MQFDDWIFPDIINNIAKFSWNLIVQDLLLINKKMWSLRDCIFLYEYVKSSKAINPAIKNRLKNVGADIDDIPPRAESVILFYSPLIKKGKLPWGLKEIVLLNSYSSFNIEEGAFPETIEDISFCNSDPDIIRYHNLTNLKTLSFSSRGDRVPILSSTIPETVENLTLSGCWPIGKLRPLKFLHLNFDFGERFCLKNILPDSLEVLVLEGVEIEDFVYPRGIKSLYMKGYNNFINLGKIPETVTELRLENYLNHLETLPPKLKIFRNTGHPYPIVFPLPDTITFLELGDLFDEDLICPSSLKHLILQGSIYPSKEYQKTVDFSRCKNLKRVELGKRFSNIAIPSGVEELKIEFRYTPHNRLPNSIKKLVIDASYGIPPGFIPDSVTYLELRSFIGSITGLIPDSVKTLKIGFPFGQNIDRLPESLTCLEFGSTFTKIVKEWPKGLTHVTIPDGFSEKNSFPDTITHLCIHSIVDIPLPKNLKVLYLKLYYPKTSRIYKPEELPKSLQEIYANYPCQYQQIPWIKKISQVGEFPQWSERF